MGDAFAERDVTQEGSCKQKWQSVMVGLGGVKKGSFSVMRLLNCSVICKS